MNNYDGQRARYFPMVWPHEHKCLQDDEAKAIMVDAYLNWNEYKIFWRIKEKSWSKETS